MALNLLERRVRSGRPPHDTGDREKMESNIISLEKGRRLKKLKDQEKVFKTYLEKLQQEELQYEANYIINKVNEENLSDEFLLKSALLMDELARRVEATQMANTITKFSENLRRKFEDSIRL